jgi:hypothetical protein
LLEHARARCVCSAPARALDPIDRSRHGPAGPRAGFEMIDACPLNIF